MASYSVELALLIWLSYSGRIMPCTCQPSAIAWLTSSSRFCALLIDAKQLLLLLLLFPNHLVCRSQRKVFLVLKRQKHRSFFESILCCVVPAEVVSTIMSVAETLRLLSSAAFVGWVNLRATSSRYQRKQKDGAVPINVLFIVSTICRAFGVF